MREHTLVADIDNSNVNLECFDFLDTKAVYYRSKGKKNLSICYYLLSVPHYFKTWQKHGF